MTASQTTAEVWSVWVGGVEVNDGYLSLDNARTLAEQYVADGYDDVAISAERD